MDMYAEAPVAQVGTYPDLWRKGRYRVELKVELTGDYDGVDRALDQLGYEVVDVDQWGRSYRHREGPRRTAELDELEASADRVSLILHQGDLDEAEIPSAEGDLDLEYGKLRALCPGAMNAGDDGYLDAAGASGYMNDCGAGGFVPERAQGLCCTYG